MSQYPLWISYFILVTFIAADVSLIRGQQESLLNRYLDPSSNPQWNYEVAEVLHLLGVNRDEKENIKVKRTPELKGILQADPSANGIGAHLSKPRFKWQYTVIAAVCSVAAMVGVVVAATCWFKDSKNGPLLGSGNISPNGSGIVALGSGSASGDKKLAQSAQMYHYQHQKQQMIALEKADNNMRNDASDEESEPEDAADDFTVYECPGMAMGGELEVKNPLFQGNAPSPNGSNGDK